MVLNEDSYILGKTEIAQIVSVSGEFTAIGYKDCFPFAVTNRGEVLLPKLPFTDYERGLILIYGAFGGIFRLDLSKRIVNVTDSPLCLFFERRDCIVHARAMLTAITDLTAVGFGKPGNTDYFTINR